MILVIASLLGPNPNLDVAQAVETRRFCIRTHFILLPSRAVGRGLLLPSFRKRQRKFMQSKVHIFLVWKVSCKLVSLRVYWKSLLLVWMRMLSSTLNPCWGACLRPRCNGVFWSCLQPTNVLLCILKTNVVGIWTYCKVLTFLMKCGHFSFKKVKYEVDMMIKRILCKKERIRKLY